MPPEEIAAIVSRDLDQSYAAEDLERLQAVYTRLGLLPAGTALRRSCSNLRAGGRRLLRSEGRLVLATRALDTGGFRAAL
jgi:hypothetical protein